jgi:hypothetical protein
VTVWAIERGNVNLLTKYQKEGVAHTQCVFHTSRAGNYFFFGGERGSVYYANDAGQVKPAFTIGEFSPIANMFFWKEKEALLVLTRNGFAYRFGTNAEGKMEQQTKIQVDASDANDPNKMLRQRFPSFLSLLFENVWLIEAIVAYSSFFFVISNIVQARMDGKRAVCCD